MNREKAETIRDVLNDCAAVIGDEDLVEDDGEPFSTHRGDTLTGDRMKTDKSWFRPARVHQSGTIGDGNGNTAPVFVVILEALWTTTDDVWSLSTEIVETVAASDCRLRVYPREHRLGPAVWIVAEFLEMAALVTAALETEADPDGVEAR